LKSGVEPGICCKTVKTGDLIKAFPEPEGAEREKNRI